MYLSIIKLKISELTKKTGNYLSDLQEKTVCRRSRASEKLVILRGAASGGLCQPFFGNRSVHYGEQPEGCPDFWKLVIGDVFYHEIPGILASFSPPKVAGRSAADILVGESWRSA